jgi:site-specific DNA-cytosine methylase
MIIIPQTPITDASFERWKCHRLEVEDEQGKFYYYIIPLIDVAEDEIEDIENVPAIFSSMSDEFEDENGQSVYTLRLFDADMPEITFEEEVEILYQILTKKEIFLK